jgi:hypothetical protein
VQAKDRAFILATDEKNEERKDEDQRQSLKGKDRQVVEQYEERRLNH